jgi:hypothetical protein
MVQGSGSSLGAHDIRCSVGGSTIDELLEALIPLLEGDDVALGSKDCFDLADLSGDFIRLLVRQACELR